VAGQFADNESAIFLLSITRALTVQCGTKSGS